MRSNRTRIAVAAVTLTAALAVAGAAPAAALAAPITPYTPIAPLSPIPQAAPLTPLPSTSPLANPDRQDFTSSSQAASPIVTRDAYTVTVPKPKPKPKPAPAPLKPSPAAKPTGNATPKQPAAVPAVQSAAPMPVAVTWDTSPGSAQAYAASKLSDYGWGPDQMACLVSLWTKESTWNYQASNPSSGAYGIPQSLPGSKMASAGADWRTNPQTQINWGLGYIKGSYGSPCGAWGHSQATGWY